jgi:hypothetical protein
LRLARQNRIGHPRVRALAREPGTGRR